MCVCSSLHGECSLPTHSTLRLPLQVLQQYGAAFVNIQSYNTTQAPAGATKLQRKLLSHAAHEAHTGGSGGARRLAQAGSSGGMLQVDMMVTVPAEQQLQVLSPGTTSKASQYLSASGILFCLLLTTSQVFCLHTLGYEISIVSGAVYMALLAVSPRNICHGCLHSFCHVQEAYPAHHVHGVL